MDAQSMVEGIEPPVVRLPRFSWVPFIGAWLGRRFSPKDYPGRVLSYLEFMPWQQKMARAMAVVCEGCQKTLRPAPESPEGVDGPQWFGCVCEGEPVAGKAYTEEEWFEICVGFVKVQGLPVRALFRLPGMVLLEVMEALFLFQTGINSPRKVMEKMALMNGNDPPSKEDGMPRGEMRHPAENYIQS